MNNRKTLLHPGVSLLLILGGFFHAQAGTIDAIYAFGDSLTDVGNFYTVDRRRVPGAPYVNGQFTNGNVWVQDLASDLGLAPLRPSLLGGTDYAYGTAESGVTAFNTSAANTDLVGPVGQLAQFQAITPRRIQTHSTPSGSGPTI